MKSSTPKTPSHLSRRAKRWWARLNETWSFDDGGLLILQAALESFDRMTQSQAILREEGPIVTDRFGQKKMHPSILVERDSRAAMLSALKQLHLDLEPLHDAPGRPSGS